MTIKTTIPKALVEKIIRGIMDNFPEASQGSALQCTGWKYDRMKFKFHDHESGKDFSVGFSELNSAFRLMFSDKWPKGCTRPPNSNEWEAWENWLCQSDATDFDAFAQLACLGEIIYG